MKWTAAYVAALVLVNVIFGRLPYPWSVLVGSAIVGGAFILRDLSDREIGRWVLLAMSVGLVLSYVLARPDVALASAAAFAAGAGADFLVFRAFAGRTFRERVVASSLVSVPLDTVVFLACIGGLGWAPFALQLASKFLALAFARRLA